MITNTCVYVHKSKVKMKQTFYVTQRDFVTVEWNKNNNNNYNSKLLQNYEKRKQELSNSIKKTFESQRRIVI